MALHIVVCVKQTPALNQVQIDPASGALKIDGAGAINPFDEYAVEEAVALKEKVAGSTVSVLSLGAASAEDTLRDALSRGADQGYLLCSDAFTGSDAWSTAYILSKAIEKIAKEKGPVNLVVFGKNTNDGDTGQVGPATAAWLDWPHTAGVRKVEQVDDSHVVVHRALEDGTDVLDMSLPAAIVVLKEINTPRVPSLKGKMAAKKAPVLKWTEGDLGCEKDKIGAAGSPTKVVKVAAPAARSGGQAIDGTTPEEKAKKLVDKLQEMKFL